MQTLSQVRRLLDEAGLRPQRRLGQNFLIDGNLMAKLLDLAGPLEGRSVLEVGPGTGSLTEELLDRCGWLTAVEADAGLCRLLQRRLGSRAGFTLLCRDVLAGKHEIAPDVLATAGPETTLVANLPYGVATPLVASALRLTWATARGTAERACRFDRLTFTVQQEVAERLAAGPGGKAYGPLSVLVATLGRLTMGAAVPATAFWPRPQVASRMLRIDFTEEAAEFAALAELDSLLAAAFGQRRKRIGSLPGRCGPALDPDAVRGAMDAAGIDPDARPEDVPPGHYRKAAEILAGG